MALMMSGRSPIGRWKLALVHVLLLPGFGTFYAHAQGFNAFSGRNHPELKWQVAETPHFRIVYPQHLEGIAEEAAPIAEASYDVLAANLDVRITDRIRIYLSDEDEITNGFAVRIGNGHTNIWVHQNDPLRWTGREKWLRHVLAHELAHIFHFAAVRSNLGWLQFLLADPLPRFWAEGLAQYQTESWNAQRGDRWLRTAVLDDQLSYTDARSLWNGTLMYAVGHAQVRYFAEQYGDSTLARLLAHRKRTLFGLGSVHDFGAAFRSTAGKSYREFYDEWRRHVNIYYNTLAGQMQRPDSLGVPPIDVPGQYLYDVRYSPDTSRAAVLGVTSLRRPVRRVYVVDRASQKSRIVAEGAINTPIAWSPDSRSIAFSRLSRGPKGSLMNDLFVVSADGRRERRLTHGRRAVAPSFSPDGRMLAFAGSERGTANIYLLDLASGDEHRVTTFTGDVQLADLSWHPTEERIAFSRFAADGTRDVAYVHLESGAMASLTSGAYDDRGPIWNHDGTRLAYTSLRDDVPNVFVLDVPSGAHHRVTHLSTGASVVDWLPPDSTFEAGRLILVSSESKDRDRAYRLSAAIRVATEPPEVPRAYSGWTSHRPPNTVPPRLEQDSGLISSRRPYRSLRNVTHVASLALPYYDRSDDWGLIGITTWVEPLGKHVLSAIGGLSVARPLEHSFFIAAYVNNQWHPTASLSVYSFPGTTRIYGDGVLVEHHAGGELGTIWPLDWAQRPYTRTSLAVRLRYVDFEPLNTVELGNEVSALPPPVAGRQTDLQVSLLRRRQRPWRDNVVHPLDGVGIRIRLTAAAAIAGTDREFARADAAAFAVLGDHVLPGLQRLYVYGRAQVQEGQSAPQDYVGLSRFDDVQINVPGIDLLLLGDAERVRGYRSYAIGNRMLFGSVEYRVPLLSSLRTRLLGVLSLGSTTLAIFADAATVWTGQNLDDAVRRTGTGVELKNALNVGGVFDLMHAVGAASPVTELGRRDAVEIYFRIRTAVAF